MSRRRRFLALRVGGATILFAVGLSLLSSLIYDLTRPDQELVALAIWTPLLGVFAGLCALTLTGLLERGLRFTVALTLGAVGGLAWFVVATVPRGLWLAWLDLPVFVIWPLSAALGFAAVVPRPGQGTRGDEGPWRPVAYGLACLALFTLLLKLGQPSSSDIGSGLARKALGAVDARTPPAATAPADPPELGAGGAPLTPPCREPALRPLPLDPVVVDSSSTARFVGRFADSRERDIGGARHVFGRTLTLWSVEGSVTGMLESRAGPAADPGARAMLERARLDESGGALTFDGHFADGFVERFRGVLTRDAIQGVIETVYADCVTRILTTDTVTLRRDRGTVLPVARPTFRTVVADMATSGAFRRERRPVAEVLRARSLSVQDDQWRGPLTSARYFSARFATRNEATRALHPATMVRGDTGSIALRDILHAVRVGSRGDAEWMVVGPPDVLESYERQVFAGARRGSPSELRWRVVPAAHVR